MDLPHFFLKKANCFKKGKGTIFRCVESHLLPNRPLDSCVSLHQLCLLSIVYTSFGDRRFAAIQFMLGIFELMKSNSRFVHEDFLTSDILQTHVPDGRQIDSHLLLRVVEEILCEIKAPTVAKTCPLKLALHEKSYLEKLCLENRHETGNAGAQNEQWQLVNQVSSEMLLSSSKDRYSHAITMSVLELLGNHSWGGKVVLVLAALAKCYGDFWLIARLCQTDVLALSLAMLKGLARIFGDDELLQQWLKAFKCLAERMVDVAKLVIEFEALPMQYVTLDDGALAVMKENIQIACYWMIRSSMSCASQMTSMIAMSIKELSLTCQTWELWSLAYKINQLHAHLQKQLDDFHLHMEKNIDSHLMHLFEEVHVDNQKVLRTLFALKNDFPLLDASSNQKVGVSILKNKEVILFISKPEVKFDRLLLIMQQLQSYPRNRQEEPYEIVWVPIVTTATWFNIDESAFIHLAEVMIFYSINQPAKLSLSVIKFIHEVWHYQGDPIMVVLDSTGKVINLEAIDMISVWGEKAYPFSVSRERELWEEENWTVEVLLSGIHPLLSYWVEDGRTICLYGSNNLEWVQKLIIEMKEVQKSGILVELVYVGTNNVEHRENILTAIAEEKLSRHLSHIDISIFWLRLESIKKLKMRLGSGTESSFIIREINSLLSFDTGQGGWLLISEGSSTEPLKLTGNKALQCFSLFQVWGQKVNKWGFLGAIRKFLDPPSLIDQCNYCSFTPYIDGMNKKVVSCPNCLSTMEKYYVYQCMTN